MGAGSQTLDQEQQCLEGLRRECNQLLLTKEDVLPGIQAKLAENVLAGTCHALSLSRIRVLLLARSYTSKSPCFNIGRLRRVSF